MVVERCEHQSRSSSSFLCPSSLSTKFMKLFIMQSIYLDEKRANAGFVSECSSKEIILITEIAKILLRYSWTALSCTALSSLPRVLPAQRPVLPVLTRVDQVSELTPQKAKLGYPVHLQGVVTVSDRRPRLFYVQDETGGIYVDLHGRNSEPLPGDRVEIFGTSNHMGPAPFVLNDRIKILGKGDFPKALPVAPTRTGFWKTRGPFRGARGCLGLCSSLF